MNPNFCQKDQSQIAFQSKERTYLFHLSRLVLFLTLTIFGHTKNLWAGSIQSVKGNKALINLDGQAVKVGQQYFGLNAAGKKKAILLIRQIKEDRAVAEITKGAAEPGFTLSEQTIPSGDPNEGSQEDKPKKKKRHIVEYTGKSWGVLGSYLLNTMSVDFKASATSPTVNAAMAGSSFGLLGFYDYPLNPDFQLRGMGGVEQLTATGSISTASCKSSKTCEVNITYLSAYGMAKYNYYRKSLRAYVHGGMGLLFAVQKSSNVLEESQITTNQIYSIGTGLDYPLSDESYIPLTLEYGLFPSTASVKSSIIFIRAGWAKSF